MKITTKYSFLLSCIILLLLYDTDKTYVSAAAECKFKCRGQSGNFLKLEEGVTYNYNLEGNTETLLPKSKGPFGDSVKLNFKAQVEVSSQAQCRTVIQLRNVQVSGPDGKVHSSIPALEHHPLIVSLHGGKLDSEVCAVHDDNFASLNIKRAVASLLQATGNGNSGTTVESDVFGVCPTDFKVTKDGDATVVTKYRDLERCQHRENLKQSLFAVSYGHVSDLQSSPLLDSYLQVEQRFSNGILESATAKENYLFRPFSNKDNGAKTKVITKLVLESKHPKPAPECHNNEVKKVFFENPHEHTASNPQALMTVLRQVTDSGDGTVLTSAARDFSTLVSIMRRTTKEDLLSIYGNCKAGAGFQNPQLAKKAFTDALFASGSGDSVAAAVELLKNNEITGDLSKYWYLSFAFVRHASASALASAMSLLDNPKLPAEAYFGIGALAGHHCREHNCEGLPQFDHLLAKFVEVLSMNYKNSREKENLVIAALKGLRNVKYLNEEAANKIAQLIKDGHGSTRVRVAALEAAQADACRGKIIKSASEVFYNRDEDSELRIKAYLVLVECPNPKFANKLSEFMETEPVNQVGAYVTSYLRNLRSSSSPDKQKLRNILYNVKPRKKFPFDIRKFSQNYEFSHVCDVIGGSAAAESNVIFSQKSYIPRSVNLNLTAEIFGHAFNLFEVTARGENLERVYEKYFGPKGYFSNKKPLTVLKDARRMFKDLETQVEDKYKNIISRSRRSVSRDETNHFASKVELMNSKLDYNVDLDLSLRVLGNELAWVNFQDIETPLTPSVLINKLGNFVETGLGSAKSYKKNHKNHFQFLDSQLAYPTSMGLALRLNAVGSGVVYLKLGGNLDVPAFLKNPKNGHANFEFVPSASVDVTGEFSVDGYAVEAGVKLSGNLHTSTGAEFTLQMLDGHGFDVNIGLPVKKSDIFTVNSEIFSFVKEKGHLATNHLLEFSVPRKDFHACFDQLQPALGLTVCADVGFPNDQQAIVSNVANYPLNGHSKLSLRVDKDDESLTSYRVKFFYDLADPRNRKIEFKVDTPGTSVPRELSVLASLTTEPEKALHLHFISPVNRFVARAAITDNDAEYSISGLVQLDKDMEYKAKLGLLKRGPSYMPLLEYSTADGTPSDVTVDGEVMVDKRPGSASRRYIFRQVRLSQGGKSYTVDGEMSTDMNAFGTDLTVGYDSHTIGIKTDFQLHSRNHFKLSAAISPSQEPNLNLAVTYEHQRGNNHMKNHFEFAHGQHLDSTPNRLTFHQELQHRYESLQSFDFSTKNLVSYPAVELEGRLDGSLSRNSLSYDMEIKYGKNKAHSKLSAKTSLKHLGDYDIDFYLAAVNKELLFAAKRDIIDPQNSKFFQKLEVKPGKAYDLSADVLHRFGAHEMKFEVVATSSNFPNNVMKACLETTPAYFDGYFKINDGSMEKVDALLKFSRTSPLHGNFKLMVHEFLDSSAMYSLDPEIKGHGSVKFVRSNTELTGSFHLVKSEDKYTGSVQAASSREGQPKFHLHLDTDTTLASNSVDSKNKLKFMEKELELNFRGGSQGKLTDGKYHGAYDLTLPDGKFFVGKLESGVHTADSNLNGDVFIELGYSEQRGGPLRKYYLKTSANNVDPKRYSILSKFLVGSECPKGTMEFFSGFESRLQDERLLLSTEAKLSGSKVEKPFQYEVRAVLSRAELNYHLGSNYGDYHLKSSGKVLTGIENKDRYLEWGVEMDTPHETARKVMLSGMLRFIEGDENKPYVFKIGQEHVFNDKRYKLDGESELNFKHGFVRGSLSLPFEKKPSTLDLTYKREIANDLRKAEVTLNTNYDNDMFMNLNGAFEFKPDADMFNGQITGQSSLHSLRVFELKCSHKKLSSTSRNTDFRVVLNDEKVEGFAKFDISPKQTLIDLTATHSAGKSRLYYKLNKKSDRQATSEGQVMWTTYGGGQLDFSSNVDIESYDNFHVLVKANSEKLELNKLKLEVGNKAVKSGAAKKINFVAQTADKKGFSGSVTYVVKESATGFTVEGKGQMELQNEKHPLTYKAEYKTLSKEADGEMGTSFKLNADFQKGVLLTEHKITDKELFYNGKFCKESQCVHTEIRNKLELGLTKIKHVASVLYQNDFGNKDHNYKAHSKTETKGFTVDHDTSVRVGERPYSLKFYIQDSNDVSNSGLVIDLPYRQIALVSEFHVPIELTTGKLRLKTQEIKLSGEVSLYLNRVHKPDERGYIGFHNYLSTADNRVVASIDYNMGHSATNRKWVAAGKVETNQGHSLLLAEIRVGLLGNHEQTIAANLNVDNIKLSGGRNVTAKFRLTSPAMHLDVGTTSHLFVNNLDLGASSLVQYNCGNAEKEAGVVLEANARHLFALVKAPNRELLKIESTLQGDKKHQVLDTAVHIGEIRHFGSKIETEGLHTLKASFFQTDNPPKAVKVIASASSSLVEMKVLKENHGNEAKLFHFALTSINNQHEKPHFEINSDHIKHCMMDCREETKKTLEEMKTLVVDVAKDSLNEYNTLISNLGKIELPDFQRVFDYYKQEGEVMYGELMNDPDFKKISELLHSTFSGAVHACNDYLNRFTESLKRNFKEFKEILHKFIETYKTIISRLTETFEKMSEPFLGVLNQASDLAFAVAEYVLDFLKIHETEIRDALVGVSGYIQEFVVFCTSAIEDFSHEAEAIYRVMVDQLKNLPIFANFEEEFKALTNVELFQAIENFYSEIVFAAKDLMDAPEVNELTENLGYLLKLPIPSFLVKFPKIGLMRELTFIRYLKSLTELPSLKDYYYTYRPLLNLQDNFPPSRAFAAIVNSQHVFTFDQNHFGFVGTCSYILAQDFLDGNFSIVANYENGKIKSLTMNDHSDTIEVFSDNTVSVNGAHGDFPAFTNNFEGYVRYGTFNLKHKSGVHITKYEDHDIYFFRISGFFFGKTRGLLGTISNEHYDDYLLPNGHVAKDVTEFVDAYKVTENSPGCSLLPPAPGHVPECTKILTSDSSLRSGFNFLNHEIYREACDQYASMAHDKMKAACDVASAYVLNLKQGYMPYLQLPDECVKCVLNGQPSSFGQSVNVVTPEGKADVVVVFERSAFNSLVFKELIMPLIPSLSNDLREKGLGDVEFSLIGFGGSGHTGPLHYPNNGKLKYEGKTDKITFKTAEAAKPNLEFWEEKFNMIVDFVTTELGREPIVRAMEEANAYPFRQGAAKIIILVNSEACPMSPTFPFSLQLPRIFTIRKYYKDLGLQFHLITPMSKTLGLSNKPGTELKNVVGFDAQKVYTFADAKKSDLEGDATNRPHLVYDQDLCLAFSQYNGGAVFNSNVFTHAKPEQQKKFVQVVSRRIAKGAIKQRVSETCSCQLLHGIFSVPKCTVTGQA